MAEAELNKKRINNARTDKNMKKKKHLRFLIALIALAALPALAMGERGLLCDRAERVLIKLGDYVFAVPWRSSLHIENEDESVEKGCFKEGDAPLEATRLSFSPHELHEKYGRAEIFEKTREGFSLRTHVIHANHFPDRPVQDDYELIKPWILKNYKSISSLPRNGNYYVWDRPLEVQFQGLAKYHIGKITYYIAADNSFKTPHGNPVSFACTQSACNTTVVWRDNVAFSYEHPQKLYVPQSKWKEFYYDFLSYMESLEVKSNAH